MDGVCIYCGTAGACEAEHVFPKSWYPETTPATVQRLTVPSCAPCNDRWERIEVALSRDLLFVISPNAPEVAGVHTRLMRAWHAAAGKSPRDRRIRAGNALKVLRTMKWVEPAAGQAQTTVRTRSGLYVRVSPARLIEPQLLKAVAEKFIRGLHYDETNEVLRDVRVARAFLGTEPRFADPELSDLWSGLEQLPINQSLGPGFWFRRIVQEEKSVWAFRIWGQITLAAVAELHHASENGDAA